MIQRAKILHKGLSVFMLLALILALFPAQCFAADTVLVSVSFPDGVLWTISDTDGKTIQVSNDNTISVEPGKYNYLGDNAATGSFFIEPETRSIKIVAVNWSGMIRNSWGFVSMEHQNGDSFTPASDNNYLFFVPAYGGDSYYAWSVKPYDDYQDCIEQAGRIYIYGTQNFESLNLSDSGALFPIKENIGTVKVPEGVEVYLTSQLKHYYARDYKLFTPDRTENGYDFYTMHIPTKGNSNLKFMLKQDGKVTRYGYAENVGVWNSDKSILTINSLQDNPFQINREQGQMDANVISNIPPSSQLSLNTGDYFDLVPLRAWQAISNDGNNEYQDPPYHYYVLGDSVEVEVTADDVIGQFGRIKALKPGVSLVLFSYEAMEWSAMGQGFTCYSSLWPELTGAVIVKVDGEENEIETNINISDGQYVYYLRSQTSETGVLTNIDDHAQYTFRPQSNGAPINSVRVRKPITVENGVLSENPEDWLEGNEWTDYSANAQGYYTIDLVEGRNIIEIASEMSTKYYVITARGLDVVLRNTTNPGNNFVNEDVAEIKINGILPALYKMGAVYNPSRAILSYSLGNSTVKANINPYSAYDASIIVPLTANDIGTVTLSEGNIAISSFGFSMGSHRGLTRTSMTSGWAGGDNADLDLGELTVLPDISFEVQDNEDIVEVNKRKSGMLEGLNIGFVGTATNSSSITLGQTWGTESQPINQNLVVNPALPNAIKNPLKIGATPLFDDGAAIVVRYWTGDNASEAIITPIPISLITKNESDTSTATISLTKVAEGNLVSASNTPLSVEVICVPKYGYPYAYEKYFYHSAKANATKPILSSLVLSPISGAMGRFDGVLEANDINYTDTNGEPQTLDFGFGFLGTEFNYTTTVPNAVSEVTYSYSLANIWRNAVVELTANGDMDISYSSGDTIPLSVGENTLVVNVKNGNNVNEYTIVVTRRGPAKTVSFALPEGASVLVMQKDKSIAANEDGTYTLNEGTYTYYVSKPGYLTKIADFTVEGAEEAMTVTVGELEAIPEQSGSVTVRIAGQDAVIVPDRTVAISSDPEDLATERMVSYNHGGFTILHALIEADGGINASNVLYTCRRGSFAPIIAINAEGLGENAGWVCEVNGVLCLDPANTLAKDGDKIDYYYNSDYAGMLHARFEQENVSVTEGNAAELKLISKTIGSESSAPLAGADIYVGNELIGQTDAEGKITIPAEKLGQKRTYFVSARKDDAEGNNTLTYALAFVTVEKDAAAEPAVPGKTTVSFRLIGDSNHGDETDFHAYTTWIATTSYTFDGDRVSVGDVFKTALDKAKLSYVGLDKNYIETIYAPAALGSFELSEFTNGQNSGWMYTVNGVHADKGLNYIYVTDGDEIVFHYVDDYVYEAMDNFEGSTGNSSTWNKWYNAEDETPWTVVNVTAENDAENKTSTVTIGEKTLEIASNGSGVPTASVDGDNVVTITVEIGETTITFAGDAAYTEEENVFTVSSTGDIPALVLVDNGDGTYTALPVSTEADGTHKITLPAAAKLVAAVKGDVDGDGVTNSYDAVIALQNAANLVELEEADILIGDLDGDGQLNSYDAVIALQISAKMDVDYSW